MRTWGRGSELGRGAGTASRARMPAPERTQARKGLPEGAEGAQSVHRDGAAEPAAPLATAADVLASPGTPLPAGARAFMEARFGHNFGHVRIHADERAAVAARHLHARAFTHESHVVFGTSQFAPETPTGQQLLAHELTHVLQQDGQGAGVLDVAPRNGAPEREADQVAQQVAAPHRSRPAGERVVVRERARHGIQGSFFGSVWDHIKSAGRAIGSAAVAVGRAIGTGIEWVAQRVRDVSTWAFDLIRNLPARLYRLGATIVQGLAGVVSFIPGAIGALVSGGLRGFADWLWERAKSAGSWILTLVSRVLDMLGGPEIAEFILHLIARSRPLQARERAAAQEVLGPNAIRWNEVRVDEGGLLTVIFHFNQARAFTTFHTVNLPPGEGLPVVVHELTHVYQYERAGSVYIGQAIHAQATVGYGYGGDAGLRRDRAAGRHYRNYNREQQAQIAQDYYVLLHQAGADLSAYQPFIAELRAGAL